MGCTADRKAAFFCGDAKGQTGRPAEAPSSLHGTNLLLVQHHDGYICATTGGSPFSSWKIRADYRTMYGEQLLKEIRDRAMELMQEDATASEDVEDEAAELVQMNAACVGDVESQAVAVGGARSGALSSVGQYVRVYNTTGGHRDRN